jgi:hypothetical protein
MLVNLNLAFEVIFYGLCLTPIIFCVIGILRSLIS